MPYSTPRNPGSVKRPPRRTGRIRRPRLQMAHAADGAVRLRADRAHRLRTGARLAARAAKIRLAFPRQQRLGPGQRTIRRVAVHLRHAGFVRHRAAHRRAHQHRHRRVSHRTRPALAAPAADHVHRTAGRRAERHFRVVGNFCHGSVAARPSVSVAAKARLVFCRCFKGRFTASACWPAASSSPS